MPTPQGGSRRIRIRRLSHKTLNFYMKNVFSIGMVKGQKHNYEAEVFLKGRKPGLFVNFGQFPSSWFGIRIPNTDPDPRHPNDCGPGGSGSGSTTM
jgi:hypothetical protein